MFVYLLIGAELALLYVVFWYLFVREPKYKEHVHGATWGSYDERVKQNWWGAYDNETESADPYLAYQEAYYAQYEQIDPNAHAEHKFVWDNKLHRYVPVSQYEATNLLSKMAERLDRQFSQLNVKP